MCSCVHVLTVVAVVIVIGVSVCVCVVCVAVIAVVIVLSARITMWVEPYFTSLKVWNFKLYIPKHRHYKHSLQQKKKKKPGEYVILHHTVSSFFVLFALHVDFILALHSFLFKTYTSSFFLMALLHLVAITVAVAMAVACDTYLWLLII